MSTAAATPVRWIYAIYCLSGFVSLGYQVTWFRIYVDQFGSSSLTFILVLTNFIAGLGAGALLSRRFAAWLGRATRIVDPLRVYGLIEILVSVSVLLTVAARLIPADAWGPFPYVQRPDGVYQPVLSLQLTKTIVATITVFLPCFLMGTTYPLLCAVFRGDARFPAALYAWNTLGAGTGVLVCQLLLLPTVGHSSTFLAMSLVNLALGLGCFRWGRSIQADAPQSEASRVADENLGVLIAVAVVSGFLTGGLEGDMFKRIGFITHKSAALMSFISFWAILAIFAGSTLVRTLSWLRLWHIKLACIAMSLAYWWAWKSAFPLQGWLLRRTYDAETLRAALERLGLQDNPAALPLSFPASLGQLLLYTGVFVFPAFLALSMLLPYVCNRLQASRRHLGLAYGLNTVAFCLGLVSFTYLAPRVSIFYSMKLMIVVLIIGLAYLLLVREGRPLLRWLPIPAVAAVIVATFLVPSEFDRNYAQPGSPASRFPVRAMKSNLSHTTYIVAEPIGDYLYFDGHSMSGTNLPSQLYMRLMAHFPLLAHPNPQRALLIGFGVGNTASAITKHQTLQAIDVVDLNRTGVLETAPEFVRTNERAFLDPRMTFINDDGRNFLNLTDRSYDLITSEPPPPLMVGIYRLYSREYYERVRDRLTPNGMMTQWLPIYQLPPRACELVAATFVQVFPHSLMFVGAGEELILVGSKSPIDLTQIEQRFSTQPKVLEDLGRLRVPGPVAMLARVLQGEGTLRHEYGSLPVISDERNDLAYMFENLGNPAYVRYSRQDVFAELTRQSLRTRDALRDILSSPEALKFYVPDFPDHVVRPSTR